MALSYGNQTIGRGKVFLSTFNTGTHTPSGFRYVGNSPTFSVSIQSDKLEHFSSDSGVRVKDKSVTLQTNRTGSLVLDDINAENLALFFFGTQATLAQTSATAQTEAFANVKLGHYYQLGITGGNPTGVRSVTNVVVTVSATPKTLGTDYTVDAVRGRIQILETGTIAANATVSVTYDRSAVSRKQIISGTTEIEGALQYIADNPDGEDNDFYLPYVRVSANGDFNLKGDDWLQLPLNVEILEDTAYSKAAIYIDGQASA